MLLSIRSWLKTDFVSILKMFVWAAAVGAGFWIGWFARGWRCEVEFTQKADRFYTEAREVNYKIDRAYERGREQWLEFLEVGCGCR